MSSIGQFGVAWVVDLDLDAVNIGSSATGENAPQGDSDKGRGVYFSVLPIVGVGGTPWFPGDLSV